MGHHFFRMSKRTTKKVRSSRFYTSPTVKDVYGISKYVTQSRIYLSCQSPTTETRSIVHEELKKVNRKGAHKCGRREPELF